VYDNDDCGNLVKERLSDDINKISEPIDWKSVIETAKSNIPDLIISDLMMLKLMARICGWYKKNIYTIHIPPFFILLLRCSESKLKAIGSGVISILFNKTIEY